MKNKNIKPKDKNGDFHGYQEWYWTTGELLLRGKYIHGLEIGYEEFHQTSNTNFYIR